MTFKIILHFSEAYHQMLQLRINVLLLPSGIPASYIQPQAENVDIHLGAFSSDKIVGCCVLTDRGNGQVQLRQMAVDTEHQGKGIGAAIVQFAEEVARKKGFRTLYLHARNPVMPFYEKSGYAVAGNEFFEVGIAHHRMEKSL
jgi:predicted GNAT family N-acyltransferase